MEAGNKFFAQKLWDEMEASERGECADIHAMFCLQKTDYMTQRSIKVHFCVWHNSIQCFFPFCYFIEPYGMDAVAVSSIADIDIEIVPDHLCVIPEALV